LYIGSCVSETQKISLHPKETKTTKTGIDRFILSKSITSFYLHEPRKMGSWCPFVSPSSSLISFGRSFLRPLHDNVRNGFISALVCYLFPRYIILSTFILKSLLLELHYQLLYVKFLSRVFVLKAIDKISKDDFRILNFFSYTY